MTSNKLTTHTTLQFYLSHNTTQIYSTPFPLHNNTNFHSFDKLYYQYQNSC